MRDLDSSGAVGPSAGRQTGQEHELQDRAGDGARPRTAVFAPMTVLENLQMARISRRAAREELRGLQLFRSSRTARQLADDVGGEQQMSRWDEEMWEAQAAAERAVVGLAPNLDERDLGKIQQVHEAGVAELDVEQNANVSLSIADRGYVLQTGRIVLADSAKALLANEDLRKAYLGR